MHRILVEEEVHGVAQAIRWGSMGIDTMQGIAKLARQTGNHAGLIEVATSLLDHELSDAWQLKRDEQGGEIAEGLVE